MVNSSPLTIRDESRLEATIIDFLAQKGIIEVEGKSINFCFRDEYDLSDLYRHLEERTKELFAPTCVRMLQEYRQLPARHPQLTVDLQRELLDEMNLMATYHSLDLTPALPSIYEYVEKMVFDTEVLHRPMINLVGTIGKGLSSEQWKRLYDAQPDQYKAQLHMAIAYADSTLAEKLLPDLKTKVDHEVYLQNVFYSTLHKYNPQHSAEKDVQVREILLTLAPREEWVTSVFGQGFTAKGIETYFGS
ncbi:hypothetical protein HYU22_05555 [Candidatus Woesearchaeota archaeon]|nr:hypothetical protein [Candidatus Woesearchaeota archaeon]